MEPVESGGARFCQRCGTPLAPREVYGRTRAACPACGFVLFVDPKVACAVLVERGSRVLLVRRRNEPGRGRWCLPGGFAEADEPPEEAARREALEETGLAVVVEGLLGAYHYTDDPRGAGILLVYQARCEAGAPVAGDDADNVGFFAPEALPPISHHTHARALAAWARSSTEDTEHHGGGA
jgi:ADP-ribose pyrophosphatase YjhB (NUDIX family)